MPGRTQCSDVDGARLPEFDDVLGARTPRRSFTAHAAAGRHPARRQHGGRSCSSSRHLAAYRFVQVRGAYNRLAQIRQIDAARVSSRSRRAITHRRGRGGAPARHSATIVMPADAPRVKCATHWPWRRGRRYDRLAKSRVDRGAARRAAGGISCRRSTTRTSSLGRALWDSEIVEQATAAGPHSMTSWSAPAVAAGRWHGARVRARSPATRIWSVEPAGHDDHRRSLASGPARIERTRHALDLHALLAPRAGPAHVRDQPATARGRPRRLGRRGARCDRLWRCARLKMVVEPRWRRRARCTDGGPDRSARAGRSQSSCRAATSTTRCCAKSFLTPCGRRAALLECPDGRTAFLADALPSARCCGDHVGRHVMQRKRHDRRHAVARVVSSSQR